MFEEDEDEAEWQIILQERREAGKRNVKEAPIPPLPEQKPYPRSGWSGE